MGLLGSFCFLGGRVIGDDDDDDDDDDDAGCWLLAAVSVWAPLFQGWRFRGCCPAASLFWCLYWERFDDADRDSFGSEQAVSMSLERKEEKIHRERG